MAPTRKVIIDTDAGVDDAYALFLALAVHNDPSVPFEIVGITTVFGNTHVEYVNRNVFIVLDSAGVTGVPVYSGAAKPLVYHDSDVSDEHYFGVDGFGDIDPSKLPVKRRDHNVEQESAAALALVRLAREHKGELTIVALGPLTNLAIAINLDPDFGSNVNEFYVMGGNMYGVGNIRPCREFNFFADPESAFVVLAGTWAKNIVMIPWETCKGSTFPLEWRSNSFGAIKSNQIELVNMLEEKLMKTYESFHKAWMSADSLCMAVVLNPNIVELQSTKYCTVELNGFHTRGQMVVDHSQVSGYQHNVTLIEKIDNQQYKDMLMLAFRGDKFPQH